MTFVRLGTAVDRASEVSGLDMFGAILWMMRVEYSGFEYSFKTFHAKTRHHVMRSERVRGGGPVFSTFSFKSFRGFVNYWSALELPL